jgi:predicted ATPase
MSTCDIRGWSVDELLRMEEIGHCQIIMATHSLMLMAYPDAQLLRLLKYGLELVTAKATDHYRVMREFCDDLRGLSRRR